MNRASEPLTLKVKHVDDLALQLAMNRMNATATALHTSRMVPRLTPPQSTPYATPKADYSLMLTAEQLEFAMAKLIALERAYKTPGIPWEEAEKLGRAIDRARARVARLNAELNASKKPGRGYGGGQHGVYAVTVPPVEYTGGITGTWEAERYTLDVHALPDDLRERLTAYLLSGAEMLPYRYQRDRMRYKAQNMCNPDDIEMFRSLHAHLMPEKAREACKKAG